MSSLRIQKSKNAGADGWSRHLLRTDEKGPKDRPAGARGSYLRLMWVAVAKSILAS
jgi:hypothetical protein